MFPSCIIISVVNVCIHFLFNALQNFVFELFYFYFLCNFLNKDFDVMHLFKLISMTRTAGTKVQDSPPSQWLTKQKLSLSQAMEQARYSRQTGMDGCTKSCQMQVCLCWILFLHMCFPYESMHIYMLYQTVCMQIYAICQSKTLPVLMLINILK